MAKGMKNPAGGAWDGQHEHKHMYNSTSWQRMRMNQLIRNPLCARCRQNGRLRPATTVHHIKAHRGDWSLFLDSTNLQSVCNSCHSGEIQMEEKRGYHTAVGNDGWPSCPDHPFNKLKGG